MDNDGIETLLCVDCDGSLIRTDVLHEMVFALLRARWFMVFLIPIWLVRGKAYLKSRLASIVSLDVSTLPYNEELLKWLREERAKGRRIILATATPFSVALAIANHLKLFDSVIATREVNLSGNAKAEELLKTLGHRSFDYVGNSRDDLAVWRVCRGAIVVGRSRSLRARAAREAKVVKTFEDSFSAFPSYLEALRVHQWLKNLLVFVPAIAAHRADGPVILASLLAFASFSFCASAVYVLNDLLDLSADRAHPRKRSRPFAAGKVPVAHGAVMSVGCLVAAQAIASVVGASFQAVLTLYFLLTLAYSIRLKRQIIVDVMILAGLYTLRILAGSAATAIVPSFWLLAFSMFIFLSLAMVKRYSELQALLPEKAQVAAGRGYQVSDLPILLSLGVAAGMISIQVFALYLNSPEVAQAYRHPHLLWLAPPLMLYWIGRVWMKSHRGEMHDDPLVFAATDWQSLCTCALLATILILASV